jgi:hypothetical protein
MERRLAAGGAAALICNHYPDRMIGLDVPLHLADDTIACFCRFFQKSD